MKKRAVKKRAAPRKAKSFKVEKSAILREPRGYFIYDTGKGPQVVIQTPVHSMSCETPAEISVTDFSMRHERSFGIAQPGKLTLEIPNVQERVFGENLLPKTVMDRIQKLFKPKPVPKPKKTKAPTRTEISRMRELVEAYDRGEL